MKAWAVKRVVTGVEVEEGVVVVVMARTPSPCCSPSTRRPLGRAETDPSRGWNGWRPHASFTAGAPAGS
jgi:hypothetical protein